MGKPKAVRKSRSASKKTATSDRDESGAESPASPKKSTPKGGARKSRAKAASTTAKKRTPKAKARAGRPKSVDRGTPTRGAKPAAKKDTPAPKKEKKSSDAEFDVERILDSRMRFGEQEYFIKWKGYSKAESTWEPASSLENCSDLIEKYLEKLNESMEVDQKDLRVVRKQTEHYMPSSHRPHGVRSSKRHSGSPSVQRRRLSMRRSTQESTRRSETRTLNKVKSGRVEKRSGSVKASGTRKTKIINGVLKPFQMQILKNCRDRMRKFNYKEAGRAMALLSGMGISIGAALFLTNANSFNWNNFTPQMYEILNQVRSRVLG